jgi:hypothetical protein
MSANVQGLSRVSFEGCAPSRWLKLSSHLPIAGDVPTARTLLWPTRIEEEVSSFSSLPLGADTHVRRLRSTRNSYALQFRNIIEAGYRSIGEIPIIIGETGVPFDLNGGEAFKTGDFHWQERQMDAICSALEENLVGFK